MTCVCVLVAGVWMVFVGVGAWARIWKVGVVLFLGVL